MEPIVPIEEDRSYTFLINYLLYKVIFTYIIEKLCLRNIVNKCNTLNKIVSQPIGKKFLFLYSYSVSTLFLL